MQESNHKTQVRMIGFAVLIVIVGILLNVATQGKFLALSNIGLIVTSMVAPSLAAWGINFIFTSGVTDLSFGAIIILAATASGIVGNAFRYLTAEYERHHFSVKEDERTQMTRYQNMIRKLIRY